MKYTMITYRNNNNTVNVESAVSNTLNYLTASREMEFVNCFGIVRRIPMNDFINAHEYC